MQTTLFTRIFLSTCLVCVTSAAPAAFAQNAVPDRPATLRVNLQDGTPPIGDFIIGPARVFLTIPAGEERTVEIEVTNREGRLAAFDLETEDFDSDPDRDGTPMFFDKSIQGSYPARAWITPEVSRMELLHAERAYVRVTVKVPEDADAGDHQAALIVTRDVESQPAGGFTIISRVAALFVITVPGDIVQEGDVDSLHAQPYFNWSLPVTLGLTARSRGTVHMAPLGTIDIRNVFGVTVDQIPVQDWYILRDSSRQRSFQWRPVFALGYYRAMTDLTAFGDRPLDFVSTGFWVVPLLPVLLLLLAIFIVSFLVQSFSSRFEVRRKKPESKRGKK